MPEGAIYVGRPSRWGRVVTTPLARYRSWAETFVAMLQPLWLAPLRGHDLACWCKTCDAHTDGLPLGVECPKCPPCHADVLLELANG